MTTDDPYAPPATAVRDTADAAPTFRWLRIGVFAVLANAGMVAGVALANAIVQRNEDAFASIEYLMEGFDESARWGNAAMMAVVFAAFFACLAPLRHRRLLHALALWLSVNALSLPLPLILPSMLLMPAIRAWSERPGWQLWIPALALAATYAFDRIARSGRGSRKPRADG